MSTLAFVTSALCVTIVLNNNSVIIIKRGIGRIRPNVVEGKDGKKKCNSNHISGHARTIGRLCVLRDEYAGRGVVHFESSGTRDLFQVKAQTLMGT